MQSEFTVNILLVDDHPENLLSLEAILEPLNVNLVRSNSGEDALRVLLEQDFALILLDVQMPGMDGFETATLIRKRRRSRQTPIIFLTAFSTSPDMLSKGYTLGAVDYLHKPIDPIILLSKATVFVDLFKKTLAIQQQSLALEQQAAQLAMTNTQLRQSEEQFRLLSEGSPIGIFLTAPDGNFTYTNPRFHAICGISAPAALQVDLLRTIHPADQLRMKERWDAYLKGEQELSDEFRLLHPSLNPMLLPEGRWVNVRSRPLYSDQQELLGHLGTLEDITERKQAEAMRAEMLREQIARQEAEAINRLKDEFLAVLSHELRTPLTAILGWAKVLIDSFTLQSARRLDETTVIRGLDIIQRNAQAQTQLIEDLLDVSRIIQGKLSLKTVPVYLTAAIEAAIESIRPQAEEKAIEILSPLDLPELQITGDAVRLQQVIWNLLSNAIKFTPSGGRVEVKVEQVGAREQGGKGAGERTIHPSTHPPIHSPTHPPTYAQITITDTGIGISAEFLPYVFDRFQQADSTSTRSYTGLGLGLAIVRHLVELHGGTIWAESGGQGQGSTLTVRLPLLQEAEEIQPGGDQTRSSQDRNGIASAAQPLSCPVPFFAGQTILVVDDEADSRELLGFILEQQGATVTLAESAAQAIAALAANPFNLLISDISMPEMDGYALIEKVRSPEVPADAAGQNSAVYNSAIPAIALTAHASEADRQRILSLGFHAYLAKPIEPDAITEAIIDLLHLRSEEIEV